MYQNTMYTYPAYVPANPQLNLAVNGNRVKTYNHEGEFRAYLKDGTEFQLEFDNNSECYVRAEITVNGKTQVSSLVLRPHQRFYLDRFMDEKKKFKFNTFLTSNDDIEKLKEIIAKNGRIEVKFYKEYVPVTMPTITWTASSTGYPYQNLYSNQISSGASGGTVSRSATKGIKSRGITQDSFSGLMNESLNNS